MEERVKSKRHFDKEFKQEAVRLVEEGHRRISDVARDLGIEANMLHRWKREEHRHFRGKANREVSRKRTIS